MKVRVRQSVKQFGWYGNKRRYPGDEFEIAGTHELGAWMEPVLDLPVSSELIQEFKAEPKKRVRRTKEQMLADEKTKQSKGAEVS